MERHAGRAASRLLAMALAFGVALAAGHAGADPAKVRLVIQTPKPGSLVEAEMNMAELRGVASADGAQATGFDVMIALDVSRSTETASGADVDGDGVVGEDPQLGLYAPGEYPPDVRSTDPDDDILHAEVAAALKLLEGFDPRRVQVGLLTFSGESDPVTHRQITRDQQDAWLQVPLTADYGRIRSALSAVLAKGPHGATDFAAGIRLATVELAGLSGAVSKPRPDSRKVVLFLTDGQPSFPAGLSTVSDPGDVEAAVAAARLAHQAGVRINSFALGPDALTRPIAATEIARVTLGTFTPLVTPGSIVAALQTVSFANVEDVGVVNLTTREDAPDVRLNPDGSFRAFVPVQDGPNRVLVNALASDGSQTNVEVDFTFRVKQGNAVDQARELERVRRLNTELMRQLEAERIKQARRRQRMKEQLEIHVERGDGQGQSQGQGRGQEQEQQTAP